MRHHSGADKTGKLRSAATLQDAVRRLPRDYGADSACEPLALATISNWLRLRGTSHQVESTADGLDGAPTVDHRRTYSAPMACPRSPPIGDLHQRASVAAADAL